MPVELEWLPESGCPGREAAASTSWEALTDVAPLRARQSHAWVTVEQRNGDVDVAVRNEPSSAARASAPTQACGAAATASPR